jgi:hypothetical protein
MIGKQNRIIHEIIHPVAEDYEICYLILMFIEGGKIVQTATVELAFKINYVPFEGSNANVYYTYSIN